MTKAKIHYHDIGDYLSREEKLAIVKKNRGIANVQWQALTPNEHGDWINLRNDDFSSFIPIGDKETKSSNTFFISKYSRGLTTARDHFCWNFSESLLEINIKKIVSFYNEQCKDYHNAKKDNVQIDVDTFINYDSTKVTWNRGFKQDLEREIYFKYSRNNIYQGLYRPFCKQHIYFAKELNDMTYQMPKIFPTKNHKNLVICISGIGVSKDFSALITDVIPDLQVQANGQCFPLYYYEEKHLNYCEGNLVREKNLFETESEEDYIRRDAVSDFILKRCKAQYGKNVTKEDIFYYVYGFLHSPKYRETFASDLKKMLPRLPLVDDVRDFWAFSKAGRALAELNLNYEHAGKHPGVIELYNPLSITDILKQTNKEKMEYLNRRVEKMRFGKKGKDVDKSTIIYNSQISLEKIPLKAYDYIVNGKSAIEWVMERYQVTTHKESGIVNDPNLYAEENAQPRYILDLLHSVITVSVETMKIVESLPQWEIKDSKEENV